VAGLWTAAGPRFKTCVSIIVVLTSRWPRLLNGADVVAVLQQVGRERMPEGVAGCRFTIPALSTASLTARCSTDS
jgi:hypothetical protein